ncbi:hypothetical protein VCRLGP7_1210051 [Vibrio crassostreae]|nr:hypothetical protein VCRLGP7_1210051 [Vibrio crassostreae]CDT51212.1 hypothetical protein VCRLGP107_700083 [Vibrio crassostreae]
MILEDIRRDSGVRSIRFDLCLQRDKYFVAPVHKFIVFTFSHTCH